MDISSLYPKWNRFFNSYYSLDGAGTMGVICQKGNLDASIQSFKGSVLKSSKYIIDMEQRLSKEKHLLVFYFHNMDSQKDYVLFIESNDQTIILWSTVQIKRFPEFSAKLLDAYAKCSIASTQSQPAEMFFFKAKYPESYIFDGSWRNSYSFRKKGIVTENASQITFTGSAFRTKVSLEGILNAELGEFNKIVSSSAISKFPFGYSTWKLVSGNPAEDRYRCQYAILKGSRLLRINAVFYSKTAKVDIDELDSIVKSIRFIEE